jgi:2-dehydro-3-deoxyphosphooctonate aldolase (KDO 8-P synthase)
VRASWRTAGAGGQDAARSRVTSREAGAAPHARALARSRGGGGLFLIAGPCVIESPRHPAQVAARLKEITASSASRSSSRPATTRRTARAWAPIRGPGIERGLEILAGVRERYGVPILTDVHEVAQVESAAQVATCCRSRLPVPPDRPRGGGRAHRRIVNVKKGQFMAPWDMKGVLEKAASTGNRKIMVTERGFSFGYNNLVVDMRSFPTCAPSASRSSST